MLDASFSRSNFESGTDLQSLCARLSDVLTARVRAAKNVHMEVEWIVSDLRALGHNVSRWDEVISEWEEPRKDRYLWIWLDEVDFDGEGPSPDATVGVSFRPRLPNEIEFRCPLCSSQMEEREVWLKIQGHGSAVAPGARVHFECPGLDGIDDVIGAESVERRRGVRVCTSCGAALLLPPRK
jgi:hypothetical protein